MCDQIQKNLQTNSIIWVNACKFHLTVAASSLIGPESRKLSVCPPPVGPCWNNVKISVCVWYVSHYRKVVLSKEGSLIPPYIVFL